MRVSVCAASQSVWLQFSPQDRIALIMRRTAPLTSLAALLPLLLLLIAALLATPGAAFVRFARCGHAGAGNRVTMCREGGEVIPGEACCLPAINTVHKPVCCKEDEECFAGRDRHKRYNGKPRCIPKGELVDAEGRPTGEAAVPVPERYGAANVAGAAGSFKQMAGDGGDL